MVADAVKDIGKPSPRIDVIEARRDDQRIHRGSALTTAI